MKEPADENSSTGDGAQIQLPSGNADEEDDVPVPVLGMPQRSTRD